MSGATQRVTLPIEGMGCGGCAAKIQKLLLQATGVEAAEVSFPRAEAVVALDPALSGRQQLVDLLTEAGYTVPEAGSPGASVG